jgi:hypothetical protein
MAIGEADIVRDQNITKHMSNQEGHQGCRVINPESLVVCRPSTPPEREGRGTKRRRNSDATSSQEDSDDDDDDDDDNKGRGSARTRRASLVSCSA